MAKINDTYDLMIPHSVRVLLRGKPQAISHLVVRLNKDIHVCSA